MEDTVIKFKGGECNAISCGSKNPLAGLIASQLLAGLNNSPLEVSAAKSVEAQSVGNAASLNTGAALG